MPLRWDEVGNGSSRRTSRFCPRPSACSRWAICGRASSRRSTTWRALVSAERGCGGARAGLRRRRRSSRFSARWRRELTSVGRDAAGDVVTRAASPGGDFTPELDDLRRGARRARSRRGNAHRAGRALVRRTHVHAPRGHRAARRARGARPSDFAAQSAAARRRGGARGGTLPDADRAGRARSRSVRWPCCERIAAENQPHRNRRARRRRSPVRTAPGGGLAACGRLAGHYTRLPR